MLRYLPPMRVLAPAAAILALFFGALTIHHGMLATEFWPWTLTPLSAMVLGAWLVAFGVGAGLVLAERDLARLRVPAIAYTAFGAFQLVVVLVHGGQMDAARWPYAFVLAAVVLTGGHGWWATRSDRSRNAAGSSDRVGMHSFWKTCVRWVSTVRRVT